jgi:hypothetical protein
MMNWIKGALLGLALIATPAMADAPQQTIPGADGNIVLHLDETYFNTINMTDLTTSGSDWFKAFPTRTGSSWGYALYIEFIVTGATSSGTCSMEIRWFKGHGSDANVDTAPLTLQADGTQRTMWQWGRTNTSDPVSTSIHVLTDADTPFTGVIPYTAVPRLTAGVNNDYSPLPPIMQIGIDPSSGNGWTGGTVTMRVWVLK